MCTGGAYLSMAIDHSENVRLCMRLAEYDNKEIYRYSRDKSKSFSLPKPPTPYANRSTSGYVGSGPFEPSRSPGILSYCSLQDPNLDEYFTRKFTRMLSPHLPLRDFQYSSRDAQRLGLRSSPIRGSKYLSDSRDTLYKVAVTTADLRGAGTTTPIYISIRGDKANLPRSRLKKPGKTNKKDKPFKFSPGSTQIFPIRCSDLGNLESILIEHDGLEKEDSWLLQGVEIMNTVTKKIWLFTCNHWLSLYKEDGKVSRELFAFKTIRTKYEIIVITGDLADAGTDSRVFITLYGRTGTSPQILLEKENKPSFQRGQTQKFVIPCTCVGPITKIRIRQDESGSNPSWFLDRICITDLKNPEWRYFFQCKNWLSSTHGDYATVREIRGTKEITGIASRTIYKISFYTDNKPGAGTRADIFIQIFGDNGESGQIDIRNIEGIKEGSIFEHEIPLKQLGALKRIKVGHNNRGSQPRWLLNKVIINDVNLARVFEFPCGMWFSDKDDEGLERVLHVKKAPSKYSSFTYEMKITTGKRDKASTTSDVYVILSGPEMKDKILDKIETTGKIWIKKAKFSEGSTDVVPIDLNQRLSPLTQVVAGINPHGKRPDWFLEDIVVFCPQTGIEQSFICGTWLSSTRGGCQPEVLLVEDLNKRKTKTTKDTWSVSVFTSDIKHAGTSAKVTLVLYGSEAKTDDIIVPMETKLAQNSTMEFRTELPAVGLPYKLRAHHDNNGVNPSWHLDKIVMTHMSKGDQYLFECKRWLSDTYDDHSIIREIPASGPGILKPAPICKYRIQIFTGNKAYAGTDANVFINIYGDMGDSGDRFLTHSSTNTNKFEKGKMDDFSIEAVKLGKISKIKLGHDSSLAGSGWFVDKVIIFDEQDPTNSITFRCNCWFDSSEGDGLTVREITGTYLLGKVTYEVEVRTGKSVGAGTDANVFIRIFGKTGDTGTVQLKTSSTNKNKFEVGATDFFKIEAEDIGEIKNIRVTHDDSGAGSAWLIDQICVIVPKLGLRYVFHANKWLDNKNTGIDLDPSKIETIDKTIPYQITVFTGHVTHAGTDAKVFIQIYGKEKKTEQMDLKSRSNTFEKDAEDVFKINATDVGTIQKIRIGHDGKKPGAGWFLDKVLIERIAQPKPPKTKSKSKLQRSVSFSSQSSLDSLEDTSITTTKKPESMKSDQEEENIEKYWFICKRWLATDEDDGMIVRELLPTDENGKPLSDLKEINYNIEVKTGKEYGSGTDANVFLTIYGKQGDSGERALKSTIDNSVNKFEENNLDKFLVKAVDLGILEKIKIRHDNSNSGAAWNLEYVFVNDGSDDYLFPCYSWLAKDKDDGLIARDIFPANADIYKSWQNGQLTKDRFRIFQEDKLETYEVKVYTTKKAFAGTDSNVHIILFGENNDSGIISLKQSRTHANKFESGNCDEFIVKSAELGTLKKIKVGHDNSMANSDWHLAKVEIDAQKLGESYVFPCNEWISKSKGDGKLERELYPQSQLTMAKRHKINYEVTTYTSNLSGASTNANVYIQIYGRNDCTEIKTLSSPVAKKKFKKGAVDIFEIALEDVKDPIEKIRIGHDDKGVASGWHLEKVLVKRLLADKSKSITYEFLCNRWLARDEDDGAIERELLPERVIRQGSVDKNGQSVDEIDNVVNILQKKTYTIRVYTGDETGTNANVFLKVYGENADSGERQLVDSKTHTDKFEKNNMDEFEWEAVDLGKLIKVTVRHDNSGVFKKDWFLKKIEVVDKYDNVPYVFHCERWLSKSKDDRKIQRTLYVTGYQGERASSSAGRTRSVYSGSATSLDSLRDSDLQSGSRKFEIDDDNKTNTELIPYTITVVTGPEKNMGSSGPFWIRLYGIKDLKTNPIHIQKLGSDYFAPGSKEIMSVEAFDVVEIKKVEVANEGVDRDSGWFLSSILIEMPTKGKLYNIECGSWLSLIEGDRKTSRTYNIVDKMLKKISKKITYTVSVITGDIDDAGTSSSLFLQLFGTSGNSSVYPLDKNEDNFERGNRDLFKLEMEDVGVVKKIRIQNDGNGDRPHWFLEKIAITNEKTMDMYEFEYNEYLSKNMGQKRMLVVDLAPINDSKKTSYKIFVKTSDVKSAGTSSSVFIKLYGDFGDSGELALKTPVQEAKPFRTNQLDEFLFADMLVLGHLNRCQVWHSNSGFRSKWHLEYVEVREMNSKNTWRFPCNKWLSLTDDDKQTFRELICETSQQPSKSSRNESSYEITVITGDKKNAGMPHNAWFVFYGEKNYSDKFVMENSEHVKLFSRSNEDKSKFTCPFLGDLKNIKLGAVVNKNQRDVTRNKWYCHEVQVKDLTSLRTYVFEIKTWISVEDKFQDHDGTLFEPSRIEEDLNKSRIEEMKKKGVIKYEIQVVTGKGIGCGTNANVFITLFGESSDSGKRPLTQKGRDLFEQGQEDKFVLECVDLGAIQKVKVEHDDSGMRSDWFLDRVQVTNLSTNSSWKFLCQEWLSKTNQLWKFLVPS